MACRTEKLELKLRVLKIRKKLRAPWKWLRPVKCVERKIACVRSRPYAKKMLQVIDHVANSRSEYHHPYLMANDEPKRVGYYCHHNRSGIMRWLKY